MSEDKANKLNSIIEYVWASGGAGVTRKEIAVHLGLKKTPHLTALINEVMAGGYIVSEVDIKKLPARLRYYKPGASPVELSKLTHEDWLG